MNINEEKNDHQLHKGIECVNCTKLFECKGKPRHVDQCLNFDPRKEKK